MSTDAATANGKIEKVSIIVSKGSLEGIYPALIMANGARAGHPRHFGRHDAGGQARAGREAGSPGDELGRLTCQT